MKQKPNTECVIAVASGNPVKVAAAAEAFRRMFPDQTVSIRSLSVPSDVAEQPLSDEETLLGARNRARHAQAACPEADFWVGIEGGVQWHGPELSAFAWVAVRSAAGLGKARSGTFFCRGLWPNWSRRAWS